MSAAAERVPALARLARQALREGWAPTLLIAGRGWLAPGESQPLLRDDQGRPTFLCAPASSLPGADGSSALLTLTAPEPRPERVTVFFAGRLTRLQHQRPGVVLVALPPDQIVVELEHPGRGPVVQHVLPVSAYWNAHEPVAEPAGDGRTGPTDPIARAAAEIVEHTNDYHGDLLCAYAAERTGSPRAVIAAATLTDLTAGGAGLTWIDATGAHHAPIRFPATASCPAELAAMLRDQLTGRRGPEPSSSR